MVPIFDGHNDTLLACLRDPQRDFFARNRDGHLDLPRAREGGFAGGFFAVFAPGGEMPDDDRHIRPTADGFEVPPVGPVERADALRSTMAMTATLFRLERASQGALEVVRSAAELRDCLERGVVAAVLHFEGAEAIGPDLAALEVFHRAGLRSLGIVWSRPNAFGHGVPFSFPSSPDVGPGLTVAGRELVRECNRLRIMIDLSHITERGFWEVAELSDSPLVATHSNVHALCPSPRNLTDAQLAAIRDSDGMVGLNFAVGFLRPDGRNDADTPLETMVRHIDYLVEALGIDRVGLGSDFDGATMPQALGDASGLPQLVEALRGHGYDDASLRKLGSENWLRVLEKTWGG